jgi:hypothetical protein
MRFPNVRTAFFDLFAPFAAWQARRSQFGHQFADDARKKPEELSGIRSKNCVTRMTTD